ncbi:MAG TPA: LytTR family DNA-binding domain-containing protein [Thermoanaerobaculia bacterium]|nr:LytTR family DNA-binding domain-containing protein [Thermoanaerobaculia bacterium]
MTLRVLIADDEILGRQRIEDLLAHHDGIEVVGTAADGREAVEQIRALRPDVVFLDVQMPAMSGTEVAATLGDEMPATIFVTAFDRHAVKAFELAAVDYLVKPFDDERFEEALRRVQKRVTPSARAATKRYMETIPVEARGQTRVVHVDKIDYITASGPYAELHVSGHTFAVRERMQTLEEQLDPARWFRAHRSVLVRLDLVDAILRRSGGDYAVRLKNGVELPVSRSRRDELEVRLGIERN